jgi:DNA-directed RNA polymerase subunit RPC12/RpoP
MRFELNKGGHVEYEYHYHCGKCRRLIITKTSPSAYRTATGFPARCPKCGEVLRLADVMQIGFVKDEVK